jgi:hypothetical protein
MVEKTEHGLVTVGEVVLSSMGSPQGSTFHLFASPPKKSNLNVTKSLRCPLRNRNGILRKRIRNGNPSDLQDLVEILIPAGSDHFSLPKENFTRVRSAGDPLSQYGDIFFS